MLCKQSVAARGVASKRAAAFLPARQLRLSVNCVAKPSSKAEEVSAAPRLDSSLLATAGLLTPFITSVGAAMAKDGEFGLLEGRTAALIHPAMMFFLFAATGYAGYLGFQWRRLREVGEEIRAAKAALPAVPEGAAPAAPSEASQKIEALEKDRKELAAGNYRDKHWQWSALLLASGVGIAIEGCANTYMRTGRLFPGPHLFAGAGIVFLWAMAAALVPAMQKGDNNARSAHIALNAVNFALFAWQVPTGLEIVGKVFQFTQWP